MDEIKIIFWIIAGLVYLFARSKKKAASQAPSNRPEEAVDEPSPGRPQTFEELLREIQEMKQPETEEAPAQRSTDRPPAKRNWEPLEIPKERKQLEDANYDYRENDNIYEVYEEAKKQAFNRPSLEETVKLQDTIVRFRQFTEYKSEHKPSLVEEYVKELKDPQGFKKAFIMSEILKKRF